MSAQEHSNSQLLLVLHYMFQLQMRLADRFAHGWNINEKESAIDQKFCAEWVMTSDTEHRCVWHTTPFQNYDASRTLMIVTRN